ncbi:amidohydrolase family protein [Xylariomycetidae sp. FL0641]|nr:amidohydrolase family protein [Xylariomycetidae sp. FL0641]KAI0021763.1 amidohydrolase family protein [Xylariomycetidae sp. FL0641]
MSTLFHNGRFFQSERRGETHSFAECMLVDEAGKIVHVGSATDEAIQDATREGGATKHDLGGRIVLPGFIDGHMHLLMMGQSLQKAALDHCRNLEDIRATLKAHAAAHPAATRVLAKGWMHAMTDGAALASMLDGIDPRPIYIDAKDLHSTWCNRAALDEMGVESMPDPEGGTIHRGADGRASGLLSEAAAVTVVWPHLASAAPLDEKLAALDAAVRAYSAVGYTGLVEMAMDENGWAALQALRRRRRREGRTLPLRVAAHWLVNPRKDPAETLAQVDRAIELSRAFNAQTDPHCRVVGIKLITDGIVDGCTAALTEPYAHDASLHPGTLWAPADLQPVVRKADAAGLQVALHAIGDAAIRMCVDSLAALPPSPRERRHRIEHLELASRADAARLGALGITASVQPVHADPAILRAWPRLLGSGRRGARAFAYAEFAAAGGAVLALGSDAPTAPHAPLPNAYVAATRRSAREPACADTCNPRFALGLAQALAAATEGAAFSCFAEGWAGALRGGRSADFVVLQMEWAPEALLGAVVRQTWFEGRKVYDVEEEEEEEEEA